jgi:hypothetical protein
MVNVKANILRSGAPPSSSSSDWSSCLSMSSSDIGKPSPSSTWAWLLMLGSHSVLVSRTTVSTYSTFDSGSSSLGVGELPRGGAVPRPPARGDFICTDSTSEHHTVRTGRLIHVPCSSAYLAWRSANITSRSAFLRFFFDATGVRSASAAPASATGPVGMSTRPALRDDRLVLACEERVRGDMLFKHVEVRVRESKGERVAG